MLILSIILFVVCLFCMGLSVLALYDNDVFAGVILIICTLLGGLLLFCCLLSEGEKQGQINALTGNVQYKLVTHKDSTKTWEFIVKPTK